MTLTKALMIRKTVIECALDKRLIDKEEDIRLNGDYTNDTINTSIWMCKNDILVATTDVITEEISITRHSRKEKYRYEEHI